MLEMTRTTLLAVILSAILLFGNIMPLYAAEPEANISNKTIPVTAEMDFSYEVVAPAQLTFVSGQIPYVDEHEDENSDGDTVTYREYTYNETIDETGHNIDNNGTYYCEDSITVSCDGYGTVNVSITPPKMTNNENTVNTELYNSECRYAIKMFLTYSNLTGIPIEHLMGKTLSELLMMNENEWDIYCNEYEEQLVQIYYQVQEVIENSSDYKEWIEGDIYCYRYNTLNPKQLYSSDTQNYICGRWSNSYGQITASSYVPIILRGQFDKPGVWEGNMTVIFSAKSSTPGK